MAPKTRKRQRSPSPTGTLVLSTSFAVEISPHKIPQISPELSAVAARKARQAVVDDAVPPLELPAEASKPEDALVEIALDTVPTPKESAVAEMETVQDVSSGSAAAKKQKTDFFYPHCQSKVKLKAGINIARVLHPETGIVSGILVGLNPVPRHTEVRVFACTKSKSSFYFSEELARLWCLSSQSAQRVIIDRNSRTRALRSATRRLCTSHTSSSASVPSALCFSLCSARLVKLQAGRHADKRKL
jgi:hypothetical protein